MKFFLDNNLPLKLAHALSELSAPAGHQVIHLRDKFDPGVQDHVWLTQLGREKGWAVVSLDRRIMTNPQNREALRPSGLTVFFLKPAWSRFKFWDKAWRLVRCWPHIIKIVEAIKPGTLYWVPINATSKLEPIGLK